MTRQIADVLTDTLEPRGVVAIEAEQLGMSMRGVRKPGAKTVTLRGPRLFPQLREHPASGDEPADRVPLSQSTI